MRALAIIAALGLTLASALALSELRTRPAPAVPVARAQPALVEPPPVEAPPPPKLPDARPQIHRAIEQAAPTLKSAHDVEQYLADLEARARRNHQLTSLEVEPGLAAIRKLAGDDPQLAFQLQAEYMQKMTRLSAELSD